MKQDLCLRRNSAELRPEAGSLALVKRQKTSPPSAPSSINEAVHTLANMMQQYMAQASGQMASSSRGPDLLQNFQLLQPPKTKGATGPQEVAQQQHPQQTEQPQLQVQEKQLQLPQQQAEQSPLRQPQATESQLKATQSGSPQPSNTTPIQLQFDMPNTSAPLSAEEAARTVEEAVQNRKENPEGLQDGNDITTTKKKDSEGISKKPAAKTVPKSKAQPKVAATSAAQAKAQPKAAAKSATKAKAQPKATAKSEAKAKAKAKGSGKGWTVEIRRRRTGASAKAGQTDTYYHAPDGRIFRTRSEAINYGYVEE